MLFLAVFGIFSQEEGVERFIKLGVVFRKAFKVKTLILRRWRIENEKRRTNRKKGKVVF